MIPEINITNKGFGDIELMIGNGVPFEIAAWIKIKINNMYMGQPSTIETVHSIKAKIDYDLTMLVDSQYICYENRWVVLKPLFKGVK